jgi:starch synthase (maltosyl-transferring)
VQEELSSTDHRLYPVGMLTETRETNKSRPEGRVAREQELDFERPSRVLIDRVEPSIDGGRFAAKRYVDEVAEIGAILLVDGHEKLKGRLLWRHESDSSYQSVALEPRVNDLWIARIQPKKTGLHFFTIEAAIDRFESWRTDLKKKIEAGQDVAVDLKSGIQVLQSWIPRLPDKQKDLVTSRISDIERIVSRRITPDPVSLRAILDDPALNSIGHSIFDEVSTVRYGHEVPVQVEPKLARFSAWYELFPRSAAREPGRHGTFKDVESRLDDIRAMGFDVLYLPPIHPIGKAFRKGKNNALTAFRDDVGSPWAIGGAEGGHKAIHPELGTIEDFASLVESARSKGIEIALDIAFQCSPDHPYVKEHPEWFKKRPDGSIQYAENPPKKYQDIYPFDFECGAWRSLWSELRSIVQFWVDHGVRVFRVDNPHTKPFHFWEWLIREIRMRQPEVIFLAEAFTRPEIMAYLAKSGFSQSYTYFSWRNSKWELTQYLEELTRTDLIETFSPNFWPNTPDILPEPLQMGTESGLRSVYMQRLILAATMASNYGIYGPAFELREHRPRHEGSEEYLDSEKYQIRSWDWYRPDSLAPLIQRINEIRRAHPALQTNRGFRFHPVDNESLIAFSKSSVDGDGDRILVVVNLDPYHRHSGMVELPLDEWEIDSQETFQVHDLLTDSRYFWSGWRNYVELDPHTLPAHVFHLRRRTRAASDFEYFE